MFLFLCNLIIIINLFFLFVSCSLFKSKGNIDQKNYKNIFNYSDATGSYKFVKESGHLKKKNLLFTKTKLLSLEDTTLEKSVVVSSLTKLVVDGEKIPILKPRYAQYTAWFEGQKYFSQIKIEDDKKKFQIITIDHHSKKRERKLIPIPQGNGIYCFFSQLSECIRTTGFLNLASKKKNGQMYFYIIWNSYPYIKDQYHNISQNLFSRAIISYDGQLKGDKTRYILNVSGQNISYHFDKTHNLLKKLWVVQGISQVNEDVKE